MAKPKKQVAKKTPDWTKQEIKMAEAAEKARDTGRLKTV